MNDITYVLETEFYNEVEKGKPRIAACHEDGTPAVWGWYEGKDGLAGELHLRVPAEGRSLVVRGHDDGEGGLTDPKYAVFVDGEPDVLENGSKWTLSKQAALDEYAEWVD